MINNRKMSQIKKEICRAREYMDHEARKAMKVPRWRKMAAYFGWYQPYQDWVFAWEAKHAASLRMATRRAFEAVKERGF